MSEVQTPSPPREITIPLRSDHPNANQVHYYFCSTCEAAKRLRIAAGVAEGTAVLFALWRLLADQEIRWLPLAAPPDTPRRGLA